MIGTPYIPDLSHPTPPASPHGGSGSPEGVVIASPFSQYTDTDTGTLYIKTSGANTNTGWTAISGGGGGDQETFTGSGSPEAVVPATAGRAFYWDTTNKVLYIKDQGTGTTGWREIIA
jgi:hypothetical protein